MTSSLVQLSKKFVGLRGARALLSFAYARTILPVRLSNVAAPETNVP
jgi:hypothetical protein